MPKKEDDREPKVGEAKLAWTGLGIRSLVPFPGYGILNFTPSANGGLPEDLRKEIELWNNLRKVKSIPEPELITIVKQVIRQDMGRWYKGADDSLLPIEIKRAVDCLDVDFPGLLERFLDEEDFRAWNAKRNEKTAKDTETPAPPKEKYTTKEVCKMLRIAPSTFCGYKSKIDDFPEPLEPNGIPHMYSEEAVSQIRLLIDTHRNSLSKKIPTKAKQTKKITKKHRRT